MTWRTVVITNKAKLSYKNDYLIVRNDEVKLIHLSEINTLIIDTTAATMTSYLISEMLSRKIKIIICDKKRNPQGEIVKVSEMGKYEDFVLKCKERLCSEAQLEIMLQTKENLIKYKKELEKSNNPLALDIEKYSHGARCTFPDFCCAEDCKIKEGKTLIRKI